MESHGISWESHGVSMEIFTFSPNNFMGYKTETATLQDRPTKVDFIAIYYH